MSDQDKDQEPSQSPKPTAADKLKEELAAVRKEKNEARRDARRLKKSLDEIEAATMAETPKNLDAERAALACCMKDPGRCVPIVREKLALGRRDNGRDAFFLEANQVIWGAMVAMFEANIPIDLLTIQDFLRKAPDEWRKLGEAAPAMLADLIDDVPSVAFLDHYLGMILETWLARRMYQEADRLKSQAQQGNIGQGVLGAFDEIGRLREKILGISVASSEAEQVVEAIRKVPRDRPIWLVSSADSVDALGDLGIHAVAPFALEPSTELLQALSGRPVVAVIELEDDPTRELAFIRRVFSYVERANVVPLHSLYPSLAPWTMAEFIKQLRESAGETDDRIRQLLGVLADENRVPFGIVVDGIYTFGERGGVILNQNELAERLVKYHDLLFAGDFWKWDATGRYLPVSTSQETDASIRAALSADPATEFAISSNVVSSVHDLMRSCRFCHPDDLNDLRSPFLVNCQSGMLNVMTGELHPHSRHYRSTMQVPVAWNPKAECPNFLKWLEQMKPEQDERDQIQEMFGYCLVPEITYHVFFFLFGPGGTGKSTLVDVLLGLIGDENSLALQLEELGNPFTRSKLVGKQVYLCGELTRKSFQHIGLIKQISAGEPIFVDVKHRDGFTFRPKGRFVMTSNVVAHTPDTSTGFERRFLQINFTKAIPRDEQDFGLLKRLLKELPGVFRWAAEGFRRLYERGHFAHTQENVRSITELQRHRNQVAMFLKEGEPWMVWDTTETAADGSSQPLWCKAEDVLERFVQWCEHYGVKPYTTEQAPFMRELYRNRESLKSKARRKQPPGGGEICRWFEGMYIPDLPEDLDL